MSSHTPQNSYPLLTLLSGRADDDLIFKDPKSGRKVMFTTANPNSTLVDQIEASGKIVVVTMWAERNAFA